MIDFAREVHFTYIQFSIDGLEHTHDRIRRSPGSFQKTIDKALELQQDFRVLLMFTVSETNKDQLVPLIHYLAQVGIQRFDFARVSPLGNASDTTMISQMN